jgi:ubiquinone/menaquinone biosynthesis C-methylase UbiE
MSTYRADDPLGYQRSMGRWSSRLAPPFIQFAAIPDATRILDVGCGTGSLTFALADKLPRASILGMDYSQAFVDYAQSKSNNFRLQFEQGDAAALHYRDAAFDATASLLVLNVVPAAEQAARELRRVTRPGGVVAAAVWDFKGGLIFLRVLADPASWTSAGKRSVPSSSLRRSPVRESWQQYGPRWA